LQLKNSNSAVAAGADHGRRRGGHVSKPRSAPSATT
jgi:hypothetical protein